MTVPMRAGADMRLLRAAVFAAVCVTLSAAGHAMASGGGIPLWALLAGWTGVLTVIAPLAGRERSMPAIAAAMLGGQIALHVMFSAGQWCAAPATDGRSAGMMALAGRLLCNEHLMRLTPGSAELIVRQAGINPSTVLGPAAHTMPDMAGMAGMTGMPGMHAAMAGTGMAYSLPMLLCHLAAALVAGWLLRRGEAALWAVIRLSAQGAAALSEASAVLRLRTALAALRALALLSRLLGERLVGARPRRVEYAAGRPESVMLQHSVVRRGPPAVVLAV